ncbi:MAG: HEAT repeat domain-containing protein [Gammaproteobacteria bacterium]|nr:HEAT repeat domain-containing protein [Gammaproteobacteria bacterium]
MLDWLLQSDFDTSVTAALWSTIVAIASTLILFLYALGLRVATTLAERRRVPLIARWRRIFASAVVSDGQSKWSGLPAIKRNQLIDILEEWNLTRTTVAGDATDNLISLADHLGFRAAALHLLQKRKIASKLLALQTLGHLRDRQIWPAILESVGSPSSAISITAAVALVDIDAEKAMPVLVPLIALRRDWPQTRVATFLRKAGSDVISEPMCEALRSGDPKSQVHLMKFAPLMATEDADEVAAELVSKNQDAGVLAAALELLSGQGGMPGIADLAVHEAWFVRLRVAQILGRAGLKEHLPLLEAMLQDPEWWVRYRAAQAIAALPFLGPNALHHMQQRQTDPFARDMLGQAIAEAGL